MAAIGKYWKAICRFFSFVSAFRPTYTARRGPRQLASLAQPYYLQPFRIYVTASVSDSHRAERKLLLLMTVKAVTLNISQNTA